MAVLHQRRSRVSRLGVLVLALSVTLGLLGAAADATKKKKKSKAGGTADITQAVGAQVPDATATTNGLLASTITVAGKKFNGTQVRDVNVTLQTTGSSGPPSPSAGQLNARVTAPNGATTWLFGNYFGPANPTGQSIAGLTLDDESPNRLGGLPPAPAANFLVSPYAGTAQPNCTATHGVCTLSALDNGPAVGIWTLRVYDTNNAGPSTSILNSWRLVVVAGKAFKTK